MESRINYIIVGFFVLLLGAGLTFFIFWLGKYGEDGEYSYYKTFFRESVSGLSKEASVKYRGVAVGIVEKISINPLNSEEVELLLRVRKDTPIKEDMRIGLKFYGLTGLAFVEIAGGSKEAPLIRSINGEIPVIQSTPSIYTRLNDILPDITVKISMVLDKMNSLLNTTNLENINTTIASLKEISLSINGYQHQISLLLEKSITMEDQVIVSMNKVATAAEGIRQLTGTIDNSIQRGDYNIRQMSTNTFEQANDLLNELRVLTTELQTLAIALQNSPSDLFFKQTSPRPGPGERAVND